MIQGVTAMGSHLRKDVTQRRAELLKLAEERVVHVQRLGDDLPCDAAGRQAAAAAACGPKHPLSVPTFTNAPWHGGLVSLSKSVMALTVPRRHDCIICAG